MEKALWARLEGKVRLAGKAIEGLRKENQKLREKISRLEGDGQDVEAWNREKTEARERAESLIQLLEGLLEGESSDG